VTESGEIFVTESGEFFVTNSRVYTKKISTEFVDLLRNFNKKFFRTNS